jgi:hypothetical protein
MRVPDHCVFAQRMAVQADFADYTDWNFSREKSAKIRVIYG